MTSVMKDEVTAEASAAGLGAAGEYAPYAIAGLFVMLIVFAFLFDTRGAMAALGTFSKSFFAFLESPIIGIEKIASSFINYFTSLAQQAYSGLKGAGTTVSNFGGSVWNGITHL